MGRIGGNVGRVGGAEPAATARRLAAGCLGSDLTLTGALGVGAVTATALTLPDRSDVFSSPGFLPANAAEWDWPDADAEDYWEALGAGVYIHAPLRLPVGKVLKGLNIRFYRATASNPLIVLRHSQAGAFSTVAPTVAWSNPTGTGSWSIPQATYAHTILSANYQLVVRADGIGDRVRSLAASIGDP